MLIAVILLNMLISYLVKDFVKSVKYTRIGYFMFWGAWAMVLFAGLVVFVFMKQPLNLSVITMIVVTILLPIIDGYRAIKLKKFWLQDNLGADFSLKLLFLELILIAGTTILALSLK
jgi:hypothetical protein